MGSITEWSNDNPLWLCHDMDIIPVPLALCVGESYIGFQLNIDNPLLYDEARHGVYFVNSKSLQISFWGLAQTMKDNIRL